jgi:Asp-tRNA(Asn)/Glu-tRNA(Gln) amidotransferase B subunit
MAPVSLTCARPFSAMMSEAALPVRNISPSTSLPAFADIIAEKGLAQVSDTGAIEAVVDDILAKNVGEAEKYRAGKKQVFGFFVGQVMRAMKGKGNPALVNDLLKKKLGD